MQIESGRNPALKGRQASTRKTQAGGPRWLVVAWLLHLLQLQLLPLRPIHCQWVSEGLGVGATNDGLSAMPSTNQLNQLIKPNENVTIRLGKLQCIARNLPLNLQTNAASQTSSRSSMDSNSSSSSSNSSATLWPRVIVLPPMAGEDEMGDEAQTSELDEVQYEPEANEADEDTIDRIRRMDRQMQMQSSAPVLPMGARRAQRRVRRQTSTTLARFILGLQEGPTTTSDSQGLRSARQEQSPQTNAANPIQVAATAISQLASELTGALIRQTATDLPVHLTNLARLFVNLLSLLTVSNPVIANSPTVQRIRAFAGPNGERNTTAGSSPAARSGDVLELTERLARVVELLLSLRGVANSTNPTSATTSSTTTTTTTTTTASSTDDAEELDELRLKRRLNRLTLGDMSGQSSRREGRSKQEVARGRQARRSKRSLGTMLMLGPFSRFYMALMMNRLLKQQSGVVSQALVGELLRRYVLPGVGNALVPNGGLASTLSHMKQALVGGGGGGGGNGVEKGGPVATAGSKQLASTQTTLGTECQLVASGNDQQLAQLVPQQVAPLNQLLGGALASVPPVLRLDQRGMTFSLPHSSTSVTIPSLASSSRAVQTLLLRQLSHQGHHPLANASQGEPDAILGALQSLGEPLELSGLQAQLQQRPLHHHQDPLLAALLAGTDGAHGQRVRQGGLEQQLLLSVAEQKRREAEELAELSVGVESTSRSQQEPAVQSADQMAAKILNRTLEVALTNLARQRAGLAAVPDGQAANKLLRDTSDMLANSFAQLVKGVDFDTARPGGRSRVEPAAPREPPLDEAASINRLVTVSASGQVRLPGEPADLEGEQLSRAAEQLEPAKPIQISLSVDNAASLLGRLLALAKGNASQLETPELQSRPAPMQTPVQLQSAPAQRPDDSTHAPPGDWRAPGGGQMENRQLDERQVAGRAQAAQRVATAATPSRATATKAPLSAAPPPTAASQAPPAWLRAISIAGKPTDRSSGSDGSGASGGSGGLRKSVQAGAPAGLRTTTSSRALDNTSQPPGGQLAELDGSKKLNNLAMALNVMNLVLLNQKLANGSAGARRAELRAPSRPTVYLATAVGRPGRPGGGASGAKLTKGKASTAPSSTSTKAPELERESVSENHRSRLVGVRTNSSLLVVPTRPTGGGASSSSNNNRTAYLYQALTEQPTTAAANSSSVEGAEQPDGEHANRWNDVLRHLQLTN